MRCCEEYRDAIWEAAEAEHITESLQAHMLGCEGCKREMADARSAMAGFAVLRGMESPDLSCGIRRRMCAPTGWLRWWHAVPATLAAAACVVWLGTARPQVPQNIEITHHTLQHQAGPTMSMGGTQQSDGAIHTAQHTSSSSNHRHRDHRHRRSGVLLAAQIRRVRWVVRRPAAEAALKREETVAIPSSADIETPCPQSEYMPVVQDDPRMKMVEIGDGDSVRFVKAIPTGVTHPSPDRYGSEELRM